MNGSRFDRAVAVVELVTGLGVATYMIVLGVTAASGGVAFFVLAAVFLAILAVMSRGSWRRVRSREETARVTTAPFARDDAAPPVLSDAGRAELDAVVTRLAGAGVFAPHVPDPADLVEAVADQGEPVEDATVLAAIDEIGYWHPGRDPDDYLGALAFDESPGDHGADGPGRLACLWTDQGVWIAAPRGGALPGAAWGWVDEG